MPPIAVEEQVASVQWQRPNDLQCRCRLGAAAARSPGYNCLEHSGGPGLPPASRVIRSESSAIISRPPGAPSSLDHGPDWYRYVSSGDLKISSAAGVLRLIRLDVAPRRSGPALIVGQVWIDSASAQVVRLAFR